MTAASSVFVNGGTLAINGVVSGSGNLTKTGAGDLTLGGASSNTMSGTTILDVGTTYLNKTGGAVAIAGPVQMGGVNSNQPNLRMLANNQFGPGVVMNFVNTNNPSHARFDLQGTTQTLAGINSSSINGAVIQNERLGGGGTSGNATLILNGSGSYSYLGYLRDPDNGGTTYKLNLQKDGTGTQILDGSVIMYTGTTTVNNGVLQIGTGGTTGNISSASAVTVNGPGAIVWKTQRDHQRYAGQFDQRQRHRAIARPKCTGERIKPSLRGR